MALPAQSPRYSTTFAATGDGTFAFDNVKLASCPTTVYGTITQPELPLPNWTHGANASAS